MAVTVPSATGRVRVQGTGTLEAMSSEPVLHFYTDLAPWWPLISPPEEYAEEAAEAARHLRAAAIPVREVLELGSGGGNNAVHLRAWFAMTLVDLNAGMLAVSQALNPECEHVVGDMRTVRLGPHVRRRASSTTPSATSSPRTISWPASPPPSSTAAPAASSS